MTSILDAGEDLVQPFMLETSGLRGRSTKIGSMLDTILKDHDYPAPVAHLVGETLTLAVLLSSMLKYEGIFTLQTQGDGPVKMLVADVTTSGEVRACAGFDPERVQKAREQLAALKTKEDSQNHLAQYLGKGYIAFTVDQAVEGAERYQGVVDLKGASLIDCVQHYFNQSEQIDTGIKMAVGQRDGQWRAGGIMLQTMPEEDISSGEVGNTAENDWRRSMILMDTVKEDELLSEDLPAHEILRRLFHEEGIRVYDTVPLIKSCRCSEEKVMNVLKVLPDDDIHYLRKGQQVEMKCEFCSQTYSFPWKEVQKILAGKPVKS